MIKQDENLLGQPIFQNPGAPVFNPNQAANMEYIYGTSMQRQASMPQREIAPFAMKDQNGDGEITRGDVIKARIEGYKE